VSDATVGIVGAGITGLALTHHLAERGVDSVAFEAEAEAGGVIRSVERDGRVLEVGPQRIRKTPGVAALVESAGLVDDLIEVEESLPLYVYADGRLREAPFDRSTFLRTDLLSWPGKLRFLAEPLTSAGDPDETAGALFERKFGTEGYRNFVGPLYGGIYGSDPAHMPARYALAGLLEREAEAGSLLTAFRQRVGGGRSFPPISFDDGMQSLPRALADAHADRVRLDTPVTAIREEGGAGTASADGRYVVETPDDAVTVDHVVVTTRGDVAAELLAPLAPSAQALRDLRRAAELRPDGTLAITMEPAQQLWVEKLRQGSGAEALERAATEVLGRSPAGISLEQTSKGNGRTEGPARPNREQALSRARQDPLVRSLFNRFGAVVLDGQPVDPEDGSDRGPQATDPA